MIKNKYIKELTITKTQKIHETTNSKKEVRKIQSWLCLQERIQPGIGTMTAIDGSFGPATKEAVKNFQKKMNSTQNGIVTPSLFEELSKPLRHAFEGVTKKGTIRSTIVAVAQKHLEQKPFELDIHNETNSGPWVRSYMDGHEGQQWFWCMGFVQAIVDQAFSLFDENFKNMMPLTYNCDTVGNRALEKKCLLRNNKIKENPGLIKPGDILLVRKSKFDWTHTAIIIDVGQDTCTTIEGNTNSGGSRNGDGVYMRVRNFKKSILDVFSIEEWVS